MSDQPMVTERATCPACSAGASMVRASFYGLSDLVRCGACGTEALHPQPSDDRLGEIYGDDYYAPWGLDADASVQPMKESTFTWVLSRWPLPAGARILDLGCATGFLLALAARSGLVPFGVDLNPAAIEQCRAKVPEATVHHGTLADHPFPEVDFDAVYMVDFLEHVREPAKELAMVRERLSRQGAAVISLPCLDSLTRKAMGLRWTQYREEHLTYFTRGGLEHLLHETGFEVVENRPTRKTLTLGYVQRQYQKYPHPVLTPATTWLARAVPPLRSVRVPLRLGEMTVVARRR
jgi:SAM-dependent methyltransferase